MFIHSLELGCSFQNDRISFLPTVFYRYKYNRFTTVTKLINDSTLFTTVQNLSYEQAAGVEFVLSGTVFSFLTANANTDVFTTQIDASNLGYSGLKSIITWRGALTCDFNLSPSTRLQLHSIYHAARLTADGKDSPYFTINMGLRQDFWDRHLTLVINASDVFKTWKKEANLDTPQLKQTDRLVRDSRIVYLGLTFHLGVPSKKTKEESMHDDDDE